MTERFWIAQPAYSRMVGFATHDFPMETGGMLLGYEAENCEAVVTTIIGPGPNAKHRRFGFVPDGEYQQAELEAHFWKTDGRETYLGDWHTHPSGATEVSLRDKRTLARIASTPSSGKTKPIMAILAGDGKSWKFGAVRFLGRERRRIFFNHYHLTLLSLQVYTVCERPETGMGSSNGGIFKHQYSK